MEVTKEINSIEKLEQIKERVTKRNLYIKRIPIKTKKRFQELTDEEFDGDFGFALKFLLDFYDGLISSPNKMLMEQVQEMAVEIEQLKTVPKEETKKNVITSLGGNVITERGG